mgnify:CR=1 FL=1
MKLVPNWRAAPRMMSMWAYFLSVCLILAALYAMLTNGGERPSYGVIIGGLVLLLVLQIGGAVGRMIAQPGLVEDVAAELRDAGA